MKLELPNKNYFHILINPLRFLAVIMLSKECKKTRVSHEKPSTSFSSNYIRDQGLKQGID